MKERILSQSMQRYFTVTLLVFFVLMPVAAGASDRFDGERARTSTTIKNFGKVNDHIYRGGQPEGEDFRQLVALGIKTIVDLRGDFEPDARAAAERAGLRYINLPLAPKSYPDARAAGRFLEIMNDQANGPYYVHCAGGRHRTGAMLAVYRMEMDGWNIERAYEEMKDFDFYTRFGHGCYKDYVYDYSRDLRARSRVPVSGAKGAVTGGQRE